MTIEEQSLLDSNGKARGMKSFILKYFNKQWMQKGHAGLVVVGIGILCSGLVIATGPQHTPKEVEEKSWLVAVMEVAPKPLSAQLKLYGRVSTPNKVTLTSAISANITEVLINEGQLINKGDELVCLDDSDAKLSVAELEAGVLDAQANLATLKMQHQADLTMLAHRQELNTLAQAKLKRHQRLEQDHLVSASSLDDFRSEAKQQAIELERQQATTANFPHRLVAAQAQLQRAKAQFGQAKLNLERTRIYAPFDGAVTQLLVAAGDRVEVGRGLVKLYDTSAMQVRAAIPARHLPDLRSALAKGNDIFAEARIDKQYYVLKLTSLTAEVNTARGGVDGLFSFQQIVSTPALGQVVDLQVTLPEQPNLVAVPAQAVYDSERVYLVENERLVAVNIEVTGEMEDAQGKFRLLISSDKLKPKQVLVVSQFAAASTGLKVNYDKEKISI